MNDELRFLINIGVNDQSVAELLDKMRQLDSEIADIFKSGAAKEGQSVTEVIKEMGEEQEKTSVKFKDAEGGMVELNKQIHEYRAELKELNRETKDSSELTTEQAQRKTELQLALKAASGEFNKQTRETIAMNAGAKDAIVTYNDLTARNRALAAEMKNVPLDDTTGKLAELKGEYAANNETLKAFDKELGNNQRNVGNYEEAITGALGQLGPFGKTLQSTIVSLRAKAAALRATGPGFATATTGARAFMVALVATGIGAIVVVLGALLALMMKIEPVTRRLEAAFSVVGTVVQVLADRVEHLLRAMQALWNRDWSGAVDHLKASYQGLGAQIVDVTKQKYALSRATDALNDAEVDAIENLARLSKEFEEARLESRDYLKTEEERMEALQRALDLKEEEMAIEKDLAQQRLDIALQDERLAFNNLEARKALAEAKAEIERIDERAFTETRRIQGELTRMQRDQAAEAKRLAQEVADEQIRQLDRYADEVDRLNNDIVASAERMMARDLKNHDEWLKRKEDADRRAAAREIEDAEFLLEVKKRLDDEEKESQRAKQAAIVGIVRNSIGAVFGDSKAGAIAQALINTYEGASLAFAKVPPPFNVPAAAAATAFGLRQVGQIRSTNLSGSGGSASAGGGAMSSAARPGARTGGGPSQRFASNQQQPSKPMVINVTGNVDREGIAWAVRKGEQIIESGQVVST